MNRLKSNFLWNTIGSSFYLLTQWLLMIIIVRIDGNYAAVGLLSQCMAIGSVALVIASYNIRQYQVSDVNNMFSQSDYVTHRVITSVITVFIILLSCFIIGYDTNSATAIILYTLFKITEAIADVYFGITQKHERMDYIGKSFVIKGALTFIAFTVLYYLYSNLIIAITGMFVLSLLVTALYDRSRAQLFSETTIKPSKKVYLKILKTCFSVFFYGLSIVVIPAIPRLYLEKLHGQEILGIYSSAATLAIIVQIGVLYLFTPLVTVFTKYHNEKNRRFFKLFFLVIFVTVILGIVVTIIAELTGEWVLDILFNQSIVPYSRIFTTATIGSMLLGLCWFLFMLLTVMRKTKTIFIGSIIGIFASVLATIVSIPLYGIDGVNYVLIFTYAVLSVYALVGIAANMRTDRT